MNPIYSSFRLMFRLKVDWQSTVFSANIFSQGDDNIVVDSGNFHTLSDLIVFDSTSVCRKRNEEKLNNQRLTIHTNETAKRKVEENQNYISPHLVEAGLVD